MAAGAVGRNCHRRTQTAERGRPGASFSPPMSVLRVGSAESPAHGLKPSNDRAALHSRRRLRCRLRDPSGLKVDLKWPNDLIVRRRKIAGILAEGVTGSSNAVESIVLEYGINVGPMTFGVDLDSRATSLESELGRPIDRAMLCAETLAAIASRYDDLLSGRFDAILDAWRARAPGSHGARVTWETPAGQRSGVTAGVDDAGALLVRTGNGVERIVGGEVIWI